MNIASKAGIVVALSQSLLEFVSEDKIDMTKLRDQKTNKAQSNSIGKQFKAIAALLKKEKECEVKKPALSLCEEGKNICDLLQKELDNRSQVESSHQEAIPAAIHDLVEKANKFSISCNGLTNTAAFQPSVPNASKAQQDSSCSESILSSAIQMSQMRIEQSKEQLRDSRAEYHKSFENMKKCTQEFDSILTEMRNLEVEKIDFDTTLKMLARGLEALGRVREQWTKMVKFFQMISNLIETCLNVNISDFVTKCESIPAIPNYRHLDFIKDMLYGPAFQASNIAHLVHMISETYVQVSDKYLMDRMSNLTTLMSLEVGSNKFVKARLELQKGCQEAQKGILELVQRNREEFDEKIDKRIDSINHNLKAVLPTPSREEQKAIEDTVHKAPQEILKEISAEDADQFV
ncbi:hypothetical protein AAFF_G00011620 [Aldrovandia affinis]|uniref:Uncharacterized protein n=1 Tax=Aldrovandia affinis TaxID=143900 RepID=A0AAD7VXK3_9TELE|nr:hypothetical protein AAFF_G00011620 [Aldrovandia affinis]